MSEVHKEQYVAYLFGELSEAERNGLEERLFANAELSAHLDEVEHDLVDAYVRDEMPATERSRFESRYLVSEGRRRKIVAARALEANGVRTKSTSDGTTKKSGFLASLSAFLSPQRLAFAGAVTVIVTLGITVWWTLTSKGPDLVQNAPVQAEDTPNPETELPTASGPVQENRAAARNDERDENFGGRPTNGNRGKRSVFAFTLLPLVRSGERPILSVPSTATAVDLTVVHDNQAGFERYLAEVRNGGGRIVGRREVKLEPPRIGRPVSIRIPADAISSGVYELALIGIAANGDRSDIGFYEFSVEIKKR